MERESFENEVIAEILNREYVCVKVDREERPDVDSVYMSVCQAMNGQGGCIYNKSSCQGRPSDGALP